MRFGAEMRRGMIKLIASDVDGTLIEDSTPDLYQEMAEGHQGTEKERDFILRRKRQAVSKP